MGVQQGFAASLLNGLGYVLVHLSVWFRVATRVEDELVKGEVAHGEGRRDHVPRRERKAMPPHASAVSKLYTPRS